MPVRRAPGAHSCQPASANRRLPRGGMRARSTQPKGPGRGYSGRCEPAGVAWAVKACQCRQVAAHRRFIMSTSAGRSGQRQTWPDLASPACSRANLASPAPFRRTDGRVVVIVQRGPVWRALPERYTFGRAIGAGSWAHARPGTGTALACSVLRPGEGVGPWPPMATPSGYSLISRRRRADHAPKASQGRL